jgi:steroid delta-isomerase-like uncharacterized protein
MLILYANQVKDSDLTAEQLAVVEDIRAGRDTAASAIQSRRGLLKNMGAGLLAAAALPGVAQAAAATAPVARRGFADAQNWVTAFFEKGAEEVLGYYADEFVWEDIEFMQTITTKEELYKAFVVFNNSGPESPFGVHRFEVLRYDGGVAGASKAVQRPAAAAVPPTWTDAEFRHYEQQILLGSDLDYDEWGYLQWVWKAQHNSDFFGIDAKGKSTTTRGVTFQCYKQGKIVRCQTFWNFRDFAMQLGVIPYPDEAWRNNPGLAS